MISLEGWTDKEAALFAWFVRDGYSFIDAWMETTSDPDDYAKCAVLRETLTDVREQCGIT